MHNKFKIVCLILAIIFVGYTLFLAISIKPVGAQAFTPLIHFGGPIIYFTPCNTGFLIGVGAPVGGLYMFLPPLFPLPPIGFVLGNAGFTSIPCVLGDQTMGEGFPVVNFGHGLPVPGL